MTRYDPFAYGEVRLDPDQREQEDQARPPAGEPDDFLFADAEQVKQAPPADSSWALLEEDVDGLLPGGAPALDEADEFGAEILGEGLLAAASPYEPEEAMPAAPRLLEPTPAVAPRPPTPAGAADGSGPDAAPGAPKARRTVKRQPLHRPVVPREEAAATPRAKSRPSVPVRRRMPVFAAALPIAICAGGGTAASWFWVMQQNPVMAGILGATTLVSALFAWLLLRG